MVSHQIGSVIVAHLLHNIYSVVEMVQHQQTLPTISRYNQLPLRVIIDAPFREQSSQTFGMLVHAASTGKWLLVQRRHSTELMILLKGSYTREIVPSLISRLIPEERELLLRSLTSKENYTGIIAEIYGSNYPKFQHNAWQQLQEAHPLIMKALERQSLRTQLAWLWPKGYRRVGHRNLNTGTRETSMVRNSQTSAWTKGKPRDLPMLRDQPEESREVAMREFMEESGLKSIPCPYIVSYECFDYIHKATLGRIFATRCWVCILKDELPLPPVNVEDVEVRQRCWFTTEEVEQLLEGVELEAFRSGLELTSRLLSTLGPK